ncbi:MAG: cadmium-translocating P-type ATPase [Thermomicrobiales bacterium]|nr:cadmium-translocating P-type ATPase [Thermomicrobiales bacterium]
MSATIEKSAEAAPQTCWTFDVSGMDCGDCARTIEEGVRRLPGVESATVNFGAGTLTVVPNGNETAPGSIVAAVSNAGYRAVPRGADVPAHLPWWQERRIHEVVVAALFWAVGFTLHHAGASTWLSAIPYLAAMALAGYPVARAVLFALKARRADMNVLMMVAAAGALPLGEWEEGSSVLILFSIGLLLQSRTVDRTRRAIQGLMRLAPDEANVLRDGQLHRVAAAELVPGDRVVVRPGERIPADGVLHAGVSEVDQSAITGESIPVQVVPGSTVYAGTMNGGGAFELSVTKSASETTLAGIVRLVEEAQSSRAPAQAFVDRFAAIYTPAVVAAAVLLAAVGALVSGEPRHWIFQGLVLLVVACPCALVISTPVALVSSIGSAARRGVLFKGGAAIESLADIKAIAFDKTGTLTAGRPAVTRVVPTSWEPADRVLALAAAVEQGANHPIARGVVQAATQKRISLPTATDARSVAGQGAIASIDGVEVTVGNPRLVDALPAHVVTIVDELESAGEIAVIVQRDGDAIGVIALADPARHASAGAIAAIGALSIKSVMLSGDSRRVADRIGGEVGVADVRAELLPEQKVTAISELMSEGGVAMVGDGINDAPALAAASVGIAMGVAGSDVALDAASVALLGDDLDQLHGAIRLARSTMRIIRQNIAVSLLVKAAFLVLTLFGVTNLWLAVAADMGTSLLVTLNALRLLRYR